MLIFLLLAGFAIACGAVFEFVADRKIAVDDLFTHRWRLDQAVEACTVADGVVMASALMRMRMR